MINDKKLAGGLTNGGFLTIGCCFPYCFLKIFFVRDKALMEREKVVIVPPVPHQRKP